MECGKWEREANFGKLGMELGGWEVGEGGDSQPQPIRSKRAGRICIEDGLITLRGRKIRLVYQLF